MSTIYFVFGILQTANGWIYLKHCKARPAKPLEQEKNNMNEHRQNRIIK